jgi:hypothetical protein
MRRGHVVKEQIVKHMTTAEPLAATEWSTIVQRLVSVGLFGDPRV